MAGRESGCSICHEINWMDEMEYIKNDTICYKCLEQIDSTTGESDD